MLNIRGVLEVEGFSDEVFGDPGAHLHAISYIENLSASDTGYQMCMDILTDGTSCDDRVKFHLLAAVKEYVNERYADEAAEGRERMRRFLARYIAVQNDSKRYDSAVVRLAAAQIHVIVFEFDYVLHWNDYFDDIVNSAYMGIKTVDHTLRIMDLTSLWLKSSNEVEDKMPDEFREIQLAREFLQVNDLGRVMGFLCNVITEYEPLEVIALKVIHDLLTWIDVRFFDELKIVGIITVRLHTMEAWQVVVDCFVLMTQRLKSPIRKQVMLETVFEVMFSRLRSSSPTDYHAKIGHLHDVMGVSLVASHDESMKCWQYNLSSVFRDMISDHFDKVQPYLTQPSLETSMSVAGFALRYVKLMEKYSCVHKQHIDVLFRVCVAKMRLSVDPNDLTEASVNGYREALSDVFKTLTRIDRMTAFETILNMQTAALYDWATVTDSNDLELSMYLLQLFCEARNEVASKQLTIEYDSLLSQLLGPLVTGNIADHSHPTIVIQFFKTLAVGASILAATAPTTIRELFTLFVSDQCIAHQHSVVRKNCARLLRDMIASLSFTVTIPGCRTLIEKTQNLIRTGALLDECQLNLYETLAFFVKLGDLTKFERRKLHNEIMNDALSKLRDNTCRWKRTLAKDREELAVGVCYAINIVVRSTLVFGDAFELELTGCAENYMSVFDSFQSIPTPIHIRGDVHASMRHLVRRFVLILGDTFLPCVPTVIQMICKTASMSYITADTEMLVYLIESYTHKLVPTLRKEFSFIGETIYLPTALALSKNHGRSDGPFKEEFERNYMAYMKAIVRNNLFDQLFRQGQKAHIFGVIYILSSGCYPSFLPHDTFQTFATYLQMEPSDMLVYLDMITEEVKSLFLTEFEMQC